MSRVIGEESGKWAGWAIFEDEEGNEGGGQEGGGEMRYTDWTG